MVALTQTLVVLKTGAKEEAAGTATEILNSVRELHGRLISC